MRTTNWFTNFLLAVLIILVIIGLFIFSGSGIHVRNPFYRETVSTPPTEPTVCPVCQECPTDTPPVISDDVIWLVGGRQDEAQNGYEYVAAANLIFIENGTPLQPFFSQVTDLNFSNILNLSNTHEILNDGVQFVIVGDIAYIMPRENTSKVPFWSISWIRYDAEKGVFICQDDAGVPGDWIGACAGKSMWVTTSMPLSQLLVSDIFDPWAKEFVNAQEAFNGKVLDDKIQVILTFRQ